MICVHLFQTGCVGVDGKCYEPGETFRDGCISYKCKPGGDFEEENFGKPFFFNLDLKRQIVLCKKNKN